MIPAFRDIIILSTNGKLIPAVTYRYRFREFLGILKSLQRDVEKPFSKLSELLIVRCVYSRFIPNDGFGRAFISKSLRAVLTDRRYGFPASPYMAAKVLQHTSSP